MPTYQKTPVVHRNAAQHVPERQGWSLAVGHGAIRSCLRPQSALHPRATSLVVRVHMGARVERLVMLNIKSMAFDELVKVKAKIDLEIELRAAKERSRLIEAVAKLRKLTVMKATAVRVTRATRAHSLKGRKLPPLYRNPRIARRPGRDVASGHGGLLRPSKAARSWRRSRSSNRQLRTGRTGW